MFQVMKYADAMEAVMEDIIPDCLPENYDDYIEWSMDLMSKTKLNEYMDYYGLTVIRDVVMDIWNEYYAEVN